MHTTLDPRHLVAYFACTLLWSTGALAQPCNSAPSGTLPQNAAKAAQQLASAVGRLKLPFGGARSSAANTPPCSAAPAATPVSATPNSAAPNSAQAAQSSPANANTPIAPTEPYTSSLIPPAPAGGLDPSKLPDVLGIHIGAPTDQVVAQAAKLYPRGPAFTTAYLSTQRYAYSSDPPYTSAIADAKTNLDGCAPNNCRGQDTLNVLLSGPPEQRAVEVVRGLTWTQENAPTIATLRAALIQKYGQTFDENPSAGLMVWLFDEQGNPMPPQSKAAALNCGGLLAFGGGPAVPLPDYLYRSPPPQVVTQQDLDRFARISCGRKIWLQAQIGGQAGGAANSMSVSMREYAADLRDAFAAENLIRRNKLAQGNQELKNAQQQAAPTF